VPVLQGNLGLRQSRITDRTGTAPVEQ
jgi:hypothetical protein